MKLAVSNIAWAYPERLDAYRLLARHGVTGLEIAPALLFGTAADPFLPDEGEARAALADLSAAGLHLVSMQSLLFGVEGAALFGDRDERMRFDAAMRRAIDLAGRFDIPNLVFGSPRQRIVPEAMPPAVAADIAMTTFRALGDAARAAGCTIAMETNPAAYGTNFLTRTADTLAFVRSTDHPAITLNLDIGALLMNEEYGDLPALVDAAIGDISHVHISEPDLAPAPRRSDTAAEVFRVAGAAGYDRWFSIEMKASGEASLATLAGSLDRLVAAVAEV